MEADDSIRLVIIGKMANLLITSTEINNNNTYLSIDPNKDISISNKPEDFKQADIFNINDIKEIHELSQEFKGDSFIKKSMEFYS